MSKWGIKISKRGHNVIEESLEIKSDQAKKPEIVHIQYILAVPYLNGAKEQVSRYQNIASTLETTQLNGVLTCIHEVSCLFEDLSTIAICAEKCGDNHEFHSLWREIRNHIRHDFREEFDDESDKRKNKRAKEILKLPDELQVDISFTPDSIKIGEIIITIKQINDYLECASNVMAKTLNEAKEKGFIK